MGMNFDYGTLGVNNAYAASFKGNPAGQAAMTTVLDEGVSDLELLSLSTKQKEQQEKKSKTAKTFGIVAAAAAAVAVIYAHSKGKKINGGAKGFFNNVGTGFKNFFKHIDDAGNVVSKEAAKAAKVTKKSIDSLSKAKVAAQEKIDDLTYQLGKHKPDSDNYKEISKQLEAAKKELKTIDKDLIKATKDGLLQSDGKYTKILNAKNQNIEQLKALQDEKTTLETLVKELTEKKGTLDADDTKKLQDATDKLTEIGFSAVKGKDGKVSIAASGQIKQLEDAIKAQQTAISNYAKNFNDVAKARIQASTDAQLLANFKATLGDAAAQQAWQVTKANTLEQAAKTSKKAATAAETAWASTIEGYTFKDSLLNALKFNKK